MKKLINLLKRSFFSPFSFWAGCLISLIIGLRFNNPGLVLILLFIVCIIAIARIIFSPNLLDDEKENTL